MNKSFLCVRIIVCMTICIISPFFFLSVPSPFPPILAPAILNYVSETPKVLDMGHLPTLCISQNSGLLNRLLLIPSLIAQLVAMHASASAGCAWSVWCNRPLHCWNPVCMFSNWPHRKITIWRLENRCYRARIFVKTVSVLSILLIILLMTLNMSSYLFFYIYIKLLYMCCFCCCFIMYSCMMLFELKMYESVLVASPL